MSMNTKDYKTKTMVVERDFPCRDNYWAVGLDIGYSAVKGISPAHYFCFPAYAKKIPENRPLLKEAADTDIRYRDNEGEWVVGNLAYEEMDASKMTESEEEVFGRKRYYSPMFKVIVRTGLGIALMEGKEKSSDGKKLYVQTGLPPKFMRDSEDLKEVFKGIHMFELKIGTAPWQTFTFSLDEQNISIMPQPLGALLSASTDINGYQLPIAKKFWSSNLLVFDPGFGTTDIYNVLHGNVSERGTETFSEYSMREVFSRTCDQIENKYHEELNIFELQNLLESGEVRVKDKKKMVFKNCNFSEILAVCSKDVCNEVIEKMKSIYDYFSSYDYIIATGGTYDAWATDFNAVFANMEGFSVIPANVNDPTLTNVFSNVRGYYFSLVNRLR